MAVIVRVYDEETHTDKAWFESSNILYSEFIEHEDDNFGELYVTFKNGATYHYKNVDMIYDYLMFITAQLENGSQGKSLNKYIKPKYECERVSDKSPEEINEAMAKAQEKTDISHTYFISGHRNLLEEEFSAYENAILKVLNGDDGHLAKFIVCDYEGADIMIQNYLLDNLSIDPNRITVYHMGDKPKFVNPKVTQLKGGFQTDDERDTAATRDSAFDIAFVRDNKIMSGTAENILRRYLLS